MIEKFRWHNSQWLEMIESHANEAEEDANNLLYYDDDDDENAYHADILDRPDLFYGHPEDIFNGSNDDEYPYPHWEGYDREYDSGQDPYERPRTAHGRPEGRMYGGGGMPGGGRGMIEYDDDDEYGEDLGYHEQDMGGLYGGMRPDSRAGSYGYGRY